MSRQLRSFVVIFTFSTLAAVSFLPVFAETSGRVTTTVTPKLISISVSPTSFSYGVVNLGGSKVSEVIVATNNGNVAEDFEIAGSTADSSGGSWQLVQTDPAQNQFKHSFSLGADYTSFTPLELDRIPFVSNIAADAAQNFKLKIDMPASLDNRPYSQYTTVVDILATEH